MHENPPGDDPFLQLNISSGLDAISDKGIAATQPRGSGRGGGLAMIHRKKWKVLPVSAPTYPTLSTVCQLSGSVPTIVATVYRPPKANNNFINDFAALLTHLATLSPNVILLGDFNIHMDNINLPLTRDFASCLDSFGFQQHIDFPTHSKGHILDLVSFSGLCNYC